MAGANEGITFRKLIMTEAPTFAVLKASGINRDLATKAAVEMAGGNAEIILIGALLESPAKLFDFQGLIIPGGFSYGDDIQSGVVLALRMQALKHELEEFALSKKRPIIGVCNGFQALIQGGLLPLGEMVTRDRLVATLTNNTSNRFESRWVTLRPEKNSSPYLTFHRPFTFPVDHGEGRLVASPQVIESIEQGGQVIFRYADVHGAATQEYPANPNNAVHAIAGITDPSGVIFGMMPHFEDFVRPEHHPNWRRGQSQAEPDGLEFIRQVVVYASEI